MCSRLCQLERGYLKGACPGGHLLHDQEDELRDEREKSQHYLSCHWLSEPQVGELKRDLCPQVGELRRDCVLAHPPLQETCPGPQTCSALVDPGLRFWPCVTAGKFHNLSASVSSFSLKQRQ